MFFSIILFLLTALLLRTSMASYEEARSPNPLSTSHLRFQVFTTAMAFLCTAVASARLTGHEGLTRSTTHIEAILPMYIPQLLRKMDPSVVNGASVIVLLLSLSGMKMLHPSKLAILEVIYIMLGAVMTAFMLWQTKTKDSTNLYDYFAVNLTSLVVGIFVLMSLSHHYGAFRTATKTAATSSTAAATLYFSTKLFTGPAFLVKNLPITSTGMNIVVFISFVTTTSATLVTLPILSKYLNKTMSLKLIGLFIATQTLLLSSQTAQTIKNLLFISGPLLLIPLIGSFAAP